MLSLPLRKSEVKPFHVNAERITAGQNGATKGDQSADLISYIRTNHACYTLSGGSLQLCISTSPVMYNYS